MKKVGVIRFAALFSGRFVFRVKVANLTQEISKKLK